MAALPKRKKHYLRKRAVANTFREHHFDELSRKLYDCQETETLVCCSNCGSHWYVITKCRQRVCPLCAYEESQRRAAYLVAMTHQMKNVKLLTLTLPRSEIRAQDQIKTLRRYFSLLRRHALFKQVVGGAYQIEVKTKTDGFHIHMHILFDGPYMPRQMLFTAWREITDVEAPQVDIRAANDHGAAQYVCKYAAKSAQFYDDPQDIIRWYLATKGQRLFATFGRWYNAKFREIMPEGTFVPTPQPCPFCKTIGHTFYARDGPYMFGKDWQPMLRGLCGSDPIDIPIQQIRDELDKPVEKTQSTI